MTIGWKKLVVRFSIGLGLCLSFASTTAFGASAGAMQWSITIPEGVWSTPVVSPDMATIYLGTESKLYAFNADGTVKWALPMSGEVSSPTVGPDGVVYVYDMGGNGALCAISPSGSPKWRHDPLYYWMGQAPRLSHDAATLYTWTDHSVRAINTADGTVKWDYAPIGGNGYPPVVGPDGTVYAITFGGYRGLSLRALRDEGTSASLKWHYASQGTDSIYGIDVGDNGKIYFNVSQFSNHECYYYAVEDLGTNASPYGAFLSPYSCGSGPTVGRDETVYFAGTQAFYAMKPDLSAARWTYALPEGYRVWMPITEDSAGTVYVASNTFAITGTLFALGLDGATQWVFPSDAEPTGGVAVGAGVVYYATYDYGESATLYAINAATVAPPSSLEVSGNIYFAGEQSGQFGLNRAKVELHQVVSGLLGAQDDVIGTRYTSENGTFEFPPVQPGETLARSAQYYIRYYLENDVLFVTDGLIGAGLHSVRSARYPSDPAVFLATGHPSLPIEVRDDTFGVGVPRSICQAFNTMTLGHDWLLSNVGFERPQAKVIYPVDPPYGRPEWSPSLNVMKVTELSAWDAFTMLHEYGHAVHDEIEPGDFYLRLPGLEHSYDKPIYVIESGVDLPDEEIAFFEGWADFFADSILADPRVLGAPGMLTPSFKFAAGFGFAPASRYTFPDDSCQAPASCPGYYYSADIDINQDLTWNAYYRWAFETSFYPTFVATRAYPTWDEVHFTAVEGVTAGILWDITDPMAGDNDNSAAASDRLERSFVDVWSVMRDFHPHSIQSFYSGWVQSGMGQSTDLDDLYVAHDLNRVQLTAYCPVDLELLGPHGELTSKTTAAPGAVYEEYDRNGDGDADDHITVIGASPGWYTVTVLPEPGASPVETYTLVVSANEATEVTLAENIPVGSGPTSYVFWGETARPDLVAALAIAPQTLNLRSQGRWVTAYVALADGEAANIDPESLVLNGSLSRAPDARVDLIDSDGELELVVKFDRTALSAQLLEAVGTMPAATRRALVSVVLTGSLYDARAFSASTTLEVMAPTERHTRSKGR